MSKLVNQSKRRCKKSLTMILNSKAWHLTVTDIQVLEQDNRFQGMAKIMHEGTSHDVAVEITVDGKNVMWKTDPGAFMFVAQKEIQKLFQ